MISIPKCWSPYIIPLRHQTLLHLTMHSEVMSISLKNVYNWMLWFSGEHNNYKTIDSTKKFKVHNEKKRTKWFYLCYFKISICLLLEVEKVYILHRISKTQISMKCNLRDACQFCQIFSDKWAFSWDNSVYDTTNKWS